MRNSTIEAPRTLAAFFMVLAFFAGLLVFAMVADRPEKTAVEAKEDQPVKEWAWEPKASDARYWAASEPARWPAPASRGLFAARRGYPYAERSMPPLLIFD